MFWQIVKSSDDIVFSVKRKNYWICLYKIYMEAPRNHSLRNWKNIYKNLIDKKIIYLFCHMKSEIMVMLIGIYLVFSVAELIPTLLFIEVG